LTELLDGFLAPAGRGKGDPEQVTRSRIVRRLFDGIFEESNRFGGFPGADEVGGLVADVRRSLAGERPYQGEQDEPCPHGVWNSICGGEAQERRGCRALRPSVATIFRGVCIFASLRIHYRGRVPSTRVVLYQDEDGSCSFLEWFGGLSTKVQDKCYLR